jgi:DNA modification methylase
MKIDQQTFNSMPLELRALFYKLPNPGSEEVLALFPESNSARIGNPHNPHRGVNHNATSYGQGDGKETNDYRDSGSAARFFYCAKASKKDRGDDNKHPTVKPTDLMRYLCRLVTPPNGLILDPFTGSGSTGKAAILEGFRFVGIEREAEYIELARARIDAAVGKSSDMLQFE